jgi:hypothetical protein
VAVIDTAIYPPPQQGWGRLGGTTGQYPPHRQGFYLYFKYFYFPALYKMFVMFNENGSKKIASRCWT